MKRLYTSSIRKAGSFRPFLVFLLISGACKEWSGTTEPDRSPGYTDSRGSLQFPDTPAGKAIAAHIPKVTAVGADAEANYQASLAALRQLPDAVAILAEVYAATDKGLYPSRWVLVQTLSDLRAETAVGPLIRIAKEPVPPPRGKGGSEEGLDPYEEESLLRMTAIQGLGHLAGTDDTAANTLGELTRHEIISIREEAARSLADAIRGVRDEQRAAFLRSLLPPNYDMSLDPSKIRPVPPDGANPRLQPRNARSPSPEPQRKATQ
jgi:hypothetical protein